MMKSLFSALIAVFIGILASPIAWAAPDPSPDPNASVVYLRASCNIANSAPGQSPLENCFEATVALRSWIYGRANPSAKLLIDIGPGQFSRFSCITGFAAGNVGGNLTFRGAGVENTVMVGVSHFNCLGTKWAFQDMTIRAVDNAVVWNGGGDSTWTNVVIDGSSASAWYDAASPGNDACAPGEQGTHRFFSSRIIGHPTSSTILNACGDNWFWGSEIVFAPPAGASGGSAIRSYGAGNRMHLYGSNIRTEADINATGTGSLTAITVSDGAKLHAHGVGIDVVGKAGWTVTAIDVSSGGEVHANQSSYFFQPGTGANFRRIVNNGGHVHAPYLWETHPNPPLIQSVDGADVAVVTSGTSDKHPHMVIYDSSCVSKWYDMVDKACRP